MESCARGVGRVSASLVCAASVLVLAQSAAAQTPAGRGAIRVVFMLDISRSMIMTTDPKTGIARKNTFASEMACAQKRAESILSTQIPDPASASISFWTFGERDKLAAVKSDLDPPSGRAYLPEFLKADPARFDHNWTYIAHSLFSMTGKLSGGTKWSPDSDIPNDAGPLFVFVLTDESGEDPGQVFDNSAYLQWLKRQQGKLQIRWQVWRIYADACNAQSDVISYDVHLRPPTVAPLNKAEMPQGNVVPLDRLPRDFSLVPTIGGSTTGKLNENGTYGVVDEEDEGHVVCRPTQIGTAQVSKQVRTYVNVDWGPAAPAQSTQWTIKVPDRRLDEEGKPVWDVLRAEVELSPGATIPPPGNLVVGTRFPVRFVEKELCDDLIRAYPGSRFVFPLGDTPGQMPTIGYVEVYDRPAYHFLLKTTDGSRPSDYLPALLADRWQGYSTSGRTFTVTAPSGVDAQIEYTLTIDDGSTTRGQTDVASLRLADGSRQMSAKLPSGAPITVVAPAPDQSWLMGAFGLGPHLPAGDYTLKLCANPRVERVPAASYLLQVDCPDCDRRRVTLTDDRVCVAIQLVVPRQPWTWWTIALLIAIVVFCAWAVWRWKTRPRFRQGLRIGNLKGYRDLREAHEYGFGGSKVLFFRHPGYVLLHSNSQSVYARVPYLDPATIRNVILGVRPNPGDKGSFLLWCAAVPVSTGTAVPLAGAGRGTAAAADHLEVRMDHEELPVLGPDPKPLRKKGVRHLHYNALIPRGQHRVTVVLRESDGREKSSETYDVYLADEP